jgi:tRNA A-37 threonylcarbamoyl transferase component Bud32
MDEQLKATARALNPQKALKLLRETSADSGWEIARLTQIEPVKHRPGRRLTIRYTVTARRGGSQLVPRTLYGKAYRGHRGERVYRILRFLRSAAPGELRFPEPLGYHPRRRFLLLNALVGPTLMDLIRGPDAHSHLAHFGHQLAALHALAMVAPAEATAAPAAANEAVCEAPEAAALRTHDAPAEVRVLQRAAERVAAAPLHEVLKSRFHKAFTRTCERLLPDAGALPALRAGSPWRSLSRVIHRDLYPDQVVRVGGQIGLVDLDEVAWGEPELDVGNFVAHLILGDLQRWRTTRPAVRQAQAFLSTYNPLLSSSHERLVAYTAAALLRLSTLERISRPGLSILPWAGLSAELVREAERLLDTGWAFGPRPTPEGRRAKSTMAHGREGNT